MASKSHFNSTQYHGPLASRMRSLMRSKNVSLADMAEQLGKSKQAISQYQLGNISPSLDALVKIADILGTTTDYLLGRTDDPNPQYSVIDDTGLSADSVQMLKNFKYSQSQGYDLLSLVNTVFSNPQIVSVLSHIDMHLATLQAKEIQSTLYQIIVPSSEKINNPSATITDEDIDLNIVESERYTHILSSIIDSGRYGLSITRSLVELTDSANLHNQKLEHIYALEALSAFKTLLDQVVKERSSSIKDDLFCEYKK